eukprot:CAMPEP_0204526400 /NCGR_PEP_ID=MMETSP0661-20131031/8422_1 /ASSEMBLY_ACC=CAM_ASM_000606 /TAXON_ID=109239 /ORGANISM="Alexandrium margalefi, Strain AMGDE01CS-322" /LENGTH=213 /DNA_ID=CAMNT_0051532245 /DNA_START=13 /DNA_END=650 /DNA_ORIENTATION=-
MHGDGTQSEGNPAQYLLYRRGHSSISSSSTQGIGSSPKTSLLPEVRPPATDGPSIVEAPPARVRSSLKSPPAVPGLGDSHRPSFSGRSSTAGSLGGSSVARTLSHGSSGTPRLSRLTFTRTVFASEMPQAWRTQVAINPALITQENAGHPGRKTTEQLDREFAEILASPPAQERNDVADGRPGAGPPPESAAAPGDDGRRASLLGGLRAHYFR